MKYAILAITRGATLLGEQLAGQLEADFFPCKGKLRTTLETVWTKYEGIICIMATGIVVRTVAPLLKDKSKDPAVVVCDEHGKFAISLLSGHLGGANALAEMVAGKTGGQEVITTASDVLGKTALDLWCRELGLVVGNKTTFTRKMGKLVDTGSLQVYSKYPLPPLPPDLIQTDTLEAADLVITSLAAIKTEAALLHPKTLVFGIGCKRDTPVAVINQCIETTCSEHNLAPQSLARIASITLKQDEQGLLAAAASRQLDLRFFTSEELNTVPGITASPTVLKVTGAKAVAEPAAMLAAGATSLLVDKMKWQGATTAVAEISTPFTIQ